MFRLVIALFCCSSLLVACGKSKKKGGETPNDKTAVSEVSSKVNVVDVGSEVLRIQANSVKNGKNKITKKVGDFSIENCTANFPESGDLETKIEESKLILNDKSSQFKLELKRKGDKPTDAKNPLVGTWLASSGDVKKDQKQDSEITMAAKEGEEKTYELTWKKTCSKEVDPKAAK